ncbi:ABC transporter ATP-binding protein [Xanthobacter oligotrophicus]|uniref:ABC transporter ATP-binding protein n=1 Tax=Xanthobacter oligotrophicus TaxID=2607286 RepID=UPI001AEF1CB1|nr:ABC transporter ATP-binding protein [Xanthobacter oligotrophicus]MCG5236181.1 ABC transporter ATP-binding protein [Xanthobacter oligotrophicus]
MNMAVSVAATTATLAPAVAVRGLRASYAGREVLSGIDLDLAGGEVLCLVGHNGAGKSTLLKILFGLHPADAGEVRLRGRPLKPHPSVMARDGVAYVPEGRGVFPGLTVKETFTLALWSASLDAGEGRARVDEVLELLPKLRDFWGKRAGQLSGGQQQMVSIGRALLSRPSILLLDEPSIGLAPKLFQDLITPIRAIQQRRGMSILLVEQNVGEAFAVSDRVVAMKSGVMIYEGKPEDLRDHARLLTLF